GARRAACRPSPVGCPWRSPISLPSGAQRRWCREQGAGGAASIGDCDANTWTETSLGFSTRALLTRAAGVEACRQVGDNTRPVSQLADALGGCWWTVMDAVVEHRTPLVGDPNAGRP